MGTMGLTAAASLGVRVLGRQEVPQGPQGAGGPDPVNEDPVPQLSPGLERLFVDLGLPTTRKAALQIACGQFVAAGRTKLLIELQVKVIELFSPEATPEERGELAVELQRITPNDIWEGDGQVAIGKLNGTDGPLQALCNHVMFSRLFGVHHKEANLSGRVKEAYPGGLQVGQANEKETAHWLVEQACRAQGMVRVDPDVRAEDNGDCWYESVAIGLSHIDQERMDVKGLRETLSAQVHLKSDTYEPLCTDADMSWDKYLELLPLTSAMAQDQGKVPSWGSMKLDAKIFTDRYSDYKIVCYALPDPEYNDPSVADPITGLIIHEVGQAHAQHTIYLVNAKMHFDPILFAQ